MTDTSENPSRRKRIRLIALVLGTFVIGGVAFGLYWARVGRFVETTDDAYVDGNVVQITPQVAGTVVAIRADDTDYVQAGDELVELDGADSELSLQQSEAELARAVRDVRNLFTQADELQAAIAVREVELRKARADQRRREDLAGSGAISSEEVQHARDVVHQAESALRVAREQLAGNLVLTDETTLDSHPIVMHAAARVREAFLDALRAHLPAPVSGVVAKRSVQLGQRVGPGTPLMAVVPPDQIWVEANFKESQLRHVRIGQPARLTADANGIEYHGEVAGFGAGTGAAFALLPAQNATGNWVKVVQRLPVRIALDRAELDAHPLSVGLSMEVRVDTHDRDATPRAVRVPHGREEQTAVFAGQLRAADALIADIVARNAGDGTMPGEAKLARRDAAGSQQIGAAITGQQ